MNIDDIEEEAYELACQRFGKDHPNLDEVIARIEIELINEQYPELGEEN